MNGIANIARDDAGMPQLDLLDRLSQASDANDRLAWVLFSALGIRTHDLIYISSSFPRLIDVARRLSLSLAPHREESTVDLIVPPKELELLAQIANLPSGHRLVAINAFQDMNSLSQRSFDIATAAFFDSSANKIVRIFDPECPTHNGNYLHVEMNEATNSTLLSQANKIASWR